MAASTLVKSEQVARESAVEWGGVGALLARVLREHTPGTHPVLVASDAMLNTPFYADSMEVGPKQLSAAEAEMKSRESKRKRRRISTLPQCIEAAVKTGITCLRREEKRERRKMALILVFLAQ